MKTRLLAPLALIAALSAATAPAHAGLFDKILKSGTKTADDTAGSALPEYKGAKHAIGVVDFENQGGFMPDMSLGQNFRLMLESALFASNRFVIVERAALDAVAQEQNLQAGGHATSGTGVAQTGKLRSARYLATGKIVDASTDTSGDLGGLNIKGIHLGGSAAKSQVVVVAKLIDTTTGQVVAEERITGQAGKTKLSVGYSGVNAGGSVGSFSNTPVGEATQDCVNQIVKLIATKLEKAPVDGTVVAVTGDQIIISLGQNYGIASGQTFVARKQGQTLTDPSTGEVLSTTEGAVIGTLQVANPQDRISYCKLVDGKLPARGDVVVLK
jgi:curli biogenesis system outer membrane secretion channel CsgG